MRAVAAFLLALPWLLTAAMAVGHLRPAVVGEAPPWAVVGLAAGLILTTAGGRWLVLHDRLDARRRFRLLIFWLPSVALLSAAVLLSARCRSPIPLGIGGFILLAEEWWAARAWRGRPRWHPTAGHSPADSGARPHQFVQQITRLRTAEGDDLLQGRLSVRLAPGQRTAVAHVVFAPPFQRLPRWYVEQEAGPAAQVRTAQLLPYGARVEVRAESTDGGGVELAFSAQSPQSGEGGSTN